jgi:predicted enzyme related to lactoylglutathione lyase
VSGYANTFGADGHIGFKLVAIVKRGAAMIDGAHVIIYSKDAEADKAFFRNVLKFGNVDVGHGWLIFKLPPAEVAVHPSDENDLHEFFLMTDDLDLEMTRLKKASIACEPVSTQGWGRMTRITLPGGGKLGLYQPRHERP